MSELSIRGRARLRRERQTLEEEAEETSEINLVPYLDIVTNILLFLLVTITTMVALGNIDVSLPETSRSATVAEPTKTGNELNLAVVITGKGFTVAGSGGVLYENNVPGKLPTVPKNRDGLYDYDGLTRLLVKIKGEFPDERRCILTANPEIQYETVIGVMDTLRMGPNKQELFPAVLFSTGFQ